MTVTYLPADGVPVTRVKSLAPGERLTVNIATEDDTLASAAVATRVTSTLPIIVERSQYWPFTPDRWLEAHNSFGVTAAGTRWGLAEGRVGGPDNYQTYILLANPGSEEASVTLTFLRTAGRAREEDVHRAGRRAASTSRPARACSSPSSPTRNSARSSTPRSRSSSNARCIRMRTVWSGRPGSNATATRLP